MGSTAPLGTGGCGAEAVALDAPPERLNLRQVGDVGEQFIQAEDDEAGEPAELGIGEGFDDDFRADAARIAHGNADGGAVIGQCLCSSAARERETNGVRTGIVGMGGVGGGGGGGGRSCEPQFLQFREGDF